MPKPKILIFITSYHPFVGGAEVAVEELARRLKNRFSFYIITSRTRRDLPKREVRSEGTVIRIGFGTRFDKYFLPFWILSRFQRDGFWNFPKSNFLLLGIDISHASLAAALYKLFHPRARFIFNIQFGLGEKRLARGRLGLIGLAFRFILSRADFVTAISTHLLELARKYGYKGPAEVVPNGVDITKFETNPKYQIPNSKTIITTSRLVAKNGIDTLISAVAEVKKEIPDIECWILGDGPEREALELQVSSLKLQENVKFLGEIPHEKIPEYLHQAGIFVRSSRSEGMGNSFVEALAAGLPIIGTPVGGILDIIEDPSIPRLEQSSSGGQAGSGQATGLFTKVDDPKDLAEKIIRLLKDKTLADSIVKNGRRIVEERFSWDKIAVRYPKIFMKSDFINILIATPLYPPQIGGPALYAKNLGEEFEKTGNSVATVSFGSFLCYPSGVRHLRYLSAILRQARKSDVIFALDYVSIGLAAALASILFRRPLVVRVEGDPLWERFVERARLDVTLRQFYSSPSKLLPKEKLMRLISGWVLGRAAKLVFSSEWRRRMMREAYGIPYEKTAIIRNVFPPADLKAKSYKLKAKVVLWAGRMLYLKNLHRLISVFQKVSDGSWELHLIGNGPEREALERQATPHQNKFGAGEAGDKRQGQIKFFRALARGKLLEKMREAAFLVLPSLSEVGPNVIGEAVSTGTPFIITKETGYTEYIDDSTVWVDPLDEDDLAKKMRFLMDEKKRVSPTPGKIYPGWRGAAEEWIRLLNHARFDDRNGQ